MPRLVLVFVVLVVYCSAVDPPSLIYKCYPNSTLQIQTPNGYQGAFANNSVNICNSTFRNEKIFLFVTGCDMDLPISVTFSNHSDIETGLVGGKEEIDAYMITCLQIPENGVFRDVSAMLDVDLEMHNQSAEYPVYQLSSEIFMMDYATGAMSPIDSVSTGDGLLWVVFLDSELHDVKPEKCIAYAGRNMSTMTNTTSNKLITVMGCTTDADLTSDFTSVPRMAYTDLKAFRFFESEYITIECDVRICPRNATACAIVCPIGRRKRDLQYTDSDKFDPTLRKVQTLLRVPLNAATSDHLCGWTGVLVLWLLYLVK